MPHHRFTAQDARFVWALGLLQLISWGSVFYGFALFMAPLEQALQMSRAESSLGFSLLLLTEGVLAFPVGRWIDRGYERWVMTLGSMFVGLALWAHSYVETPTQFYAVWIGLGIGMAGTLYPPAFAVLTRRFPWHFRRAIIILSFLGGLASTVFIPFIAWLLHVLNWREVMCVLAALHLGLCAPLHFYLLRTPGHRTTKSEKKATPEPASAWWVHVPTVGSLC
jgi:MFS family permease